MERTFALIKPDAVRAKNVGNIISIIEQHDFSILRMKKITLDRNLAALFYDVHKDKPFFDEVIDFITSGPVVAIALEKEGAIKAWRDLMGSTDPEKADKGTIRKEYGTSIGSNAVHGSDGQNTAEKELRLFFSDLK